MGDDVNRAEAAKAGEGISHLPHRVGLRVEHDRLHPGSQSAQQLTDVGDAGVDECDFAADDARTVVSRAVFYCVALKHLTRAPKVLVPASPANHGIRPPARLIITQRL
jgi:hypothetical protein